MSPTAAVDLPPSAIPAATNTPQAQDDPPQPLDRLRLTHDLNNPTVPASDLLPHHIISSPYPSATHTLDLRRVPAASALFARALQTLRPSTPAYATAPYDRAFDWAALFATLRTLAADAGAAPFPRSAFYVVAFRSVLKDGADGERLGLLDAMSHEEAVEAGGLLKYWFGVPDAERRNLATCFWHSREDAAEGGKGPWHKKARAAAATMYESIRFETRRLTVEEGANEWAWEDWKH
ncbi:hypothetical protein BKCO1_4000092 [Neofusicoccum parvum]|uniref:Putative upf0643 protein n=1 Tax=Botryosphaeria parva (strain UCR-NP2) TaxID=1287680 RepID=R1GWM0_BOTPV|nr:putative upf0643 protein [Neofusicoccum parvum UCRNP2]GME41831.1 hypothetical protein BKCO1_4000092 [Neofusicoccum parvum]